MIKKILLGLSIFLFVCTGPLSGIVEGLNARQVEVNLRSNISSEYDFEMETINAGTYSAVQEFKDVLENNDYDSIGIYYGNKLPCYRLNHGYKDLILSFSISFNFTRQDIQLGASNYWIRVPLDGRDVRQIIVYEGNRSPLTWPDYSDAIARAVNGENLKRAIFDETGIYLNLNYIIYPGFKSFSFFAEPYSGISITSYISNEIYSIGESKYTYFSARREQGPGYIAYRIENINEEVFPTSPPVSFLFQTGNDINGWSSMWIEAGDTFYFTEALHPLADDLDNKSLSFYFPFRSLSTVNFNVYFEFLTLGALGLTNPYTSTSSYNVSFTLNSQIDYVLASLPYYLNESAYGGSLSTNHFWYITIEPDRDVLLLFRNVTSPTDGARLINYFGSGGFCNYHKLFFVTDIQTGVWARVYEYSMVSFIDFGWATGYRFPGYTEVYIFLDTGARLFFNGSVEDLWDRVLEDEYTVTEAIRDAINGAVQWLADDYLKNIYSLGRKALQIGEWFVDFVDYLIGFWDFITQLIGSVREFFEKIALGLTIALGVILLQIGASVIKNREEEETIKEAIKDELEPFKKALGRGFKKKSDRKEKVRRLKKKYREGGG